MLLVRAIAQSQNNPRIALRYHGPLYVGWTLGYEHQAKPIFSAFACEPTYSALGNLILRVAMIGHISMGFFTYEKYRVALSLLPKLVELVLKK